jgi:hypothetical protein
MLNIVKKKREREKYTYVPPLLLCLYIASVADPDPGSGIGAFLTPGSRIPDPGSQTHIFESLVTIFG